ncbi:MAG: hypothetical protein ACFBRM_14815 [Pikeienuella sp.]
MTQTNPAQAFAEELARVKAEIHAYPRPIAGCDAQFNHLLARRSELLSALAQAQRAGDQTAAGT